MYANAHIRYTIRHAWYEHRMMRGRKVVTLGVFGYWFRLHAACIAAFNLDREEI